MKWLYRLLINWIDRLNEEQCEGFKVCVGNSSCNVLRKCSSRNVNDKFTKVMFSISIVTTVMLLLACIV